MEYIFDINLTEDDILEFYKELSLLNEKNFCEEPNCN